MSQQPSILRLGAAAEQLSISESTLRRWAKDGRIRIIKIGERASGVLRTDLEKFLTEISKQ